MRRIALLIALLVVVAACGEPADELVVDETTPTTQATTAPEPSVQEDDGSDTAAPSTDAALFAYSYKAGDTYTYAFDLVQDIALSIEAEGDAAFFEGSEEPPSEVLAQVAIGGTVTYSVAPGPDPETYLLKVSGAFDKVTVNGTMDGVPIEDALALAEAGAPDLVQVPNLSLLIDSQGNVLEGELDGEKLPDFEMFANPFAGFEDITSGGLTSHFGPAFPDEPLMVESTWGDSWSEQVMDQTITSETKYFVTDIKDGVAEIDIATSFSGVTIDLGDLFAMLFQGFAGLGEELGTEQETTEASFPEDLGLDFVITLEPAESSGTAWFHQGDGITNRYTQDTALAMAFDFAIDDGTQKGSVLMNMSLGIALDVELVNGGA